MLIYNLLPDLLAFANSLQLSNSKTLQLSHSKNPPPHNSPPPNPPLQQHLPGIQHFRQVDEGCDEVISGQGVAGAEGEIDGFAEEIVELIEGVGSEGIFEGEERMVVFFIGEVALQEFGGAIRGFIEEPLFGFELHEVAAADKRPYVMAELQDFHGIAVDARAAFHGVLHDLEQQVFGFG